MTNGVFLSSQVKLGRLTAISLVAKLDDQGADSWLTRYEAKSAFKNGKGVLYKKLIARGFPRCKTGDEFFEELSKKVVQQNPEFKKTLITDFRKAQATLKRARLFVWKKTRVTEAFNRFKQEASKLAAYEPKILSDALVNILTDPLFKPLSQKVYNLLLNLGLPIDGSHLFRLSTGSVIPRLKKEASFLLSRAFAADNTEVLKEAFQGGAFAINAEMMSRKALPDVHSKLKLFKVMAEKFGDSQKDKYAEVLIGLLNHPVWHIRRIAIEALGRHFSIESTEALMAVRTQDPDVSLREIAAKVLLDSNQGRIWRAIRERGQASRGKKTFNLWKGSSKTKRKQSAEEALVKIIVENPNWGPGAIAAKKLAALSEEGRARLRKLVNDPSQLVTITLRQAMIVRAVALDALRPYRKAK